MTNIKNLAAAEVATVLIDIGVAGFTGSSDGTTSSGATTSAATASRPSTSDAPPGGGVSADSVTTAFLPRTFSAGVRKEVSGSTSGNRSPVSTTSSHMGANGTLTAERS